MTANHGVPAIILCGGRGGRISEVNLLLPKPLLPLGERPTVMEGDEDRAGSVAAEVDHLGSQRS